ncbi:hypothetical protein [Alkaliphilus sp. B6464]|uniref:hypothetical protein n=1 Tax=Alkaliphilus sp. B6464 TaxID=2731219 RepID=UPI001BA7BCAD|nr:hypothetical protein [Alkaliphilus sp. B6464]QUH20248.1 hypothetical protein HYG84_10240 [Alkaliphilus sp. B6464]
MEVSNIIIILLFILPGMLSEKIAHELDCPSKPSHSDFKVTINGVMLSFPILFINGMFFALAYHIVTLESFIEKFDDFFFLLRFTLAVLFTSFALGVSREYLNKLWTMFIDYLRGMRNKMPSSTKNCWQKFLIEKNECRFLEVIQDGQSYKGFAYEYSTLNEDMSIVLGIDKSFYEHDDFDIDRLFTKVIGTYIDIEKNVVIKDYDMSEYYKWNEEKILESQATS